MARLSAADDEQVRITGAVRWIGYGFCAVVALGALGAGYAYAEGGDWLKAIAVSLGLLIPAGAVVFALRVQPEPYDPNKSQWRQYAMKTHDPDRQLTRREVIGYRVWFVVSMVLGVALFLASGSWNALLWPVLSIATIWRWSDAVRSQVFKRLRPHDGSASE